MKNNQLSFFRKCLFAVGLILSALIGIWIPGVYPAVMLWRRILTCTTVMLIYVAAAVPLFLMELKDSRNYDPLFTGGAVYYRGFVVYTVASVIRIFLIQTMMIDFSLAVISQLVTVFVFAVYVFLACFTGHHTAQVAKKERMKTADLDLMREKLQMLTVRTELLGEDKSEIKNLVKKLTEDVRYLSPSDRKTAESLEKEMLSLLDSIAADPVFGESKNSSAERVLIELKELDVLCKQRKTIN